MKKNEVKKMTKHQYFKMCLFTGSPQTNEMNVIGSHKHEIFTHPNCNRISLSDKRVIQYDKMNILPHGHYK